MDRWKHDTFKVLESMVSNTLAVIKWKLSMIIVAAKIAYFY